MLFQFSKLKIILFLIGFLLSPIFCFGQGTVSKSAPNDPLEYILLNIGNVFIFDVSASDGKMSRIDAVSDSGSSWVGSGINTSTANFTGTPNSGKSGTFKPGFSGQVKLTGSGSGPVQTYDWTAKAKYELAGEFQVEIKPEDNFNGNRSKLGIGEPAEVVVMPPEGETYEVIFDSMEIIGNNRMNLSTLNWNHTGNNFVAGDYKGEATIKVWAKVNGEKKGPKTIQVSVLEPTGVKFVKKESKLTTDVQVNLPNYAASVDAYKFVIRCWCYIEPQTVSFFAIKVRERQSIGIATGSQIPWTNFVHPEWQYTLGIFKNKEKLGNLVNGGDKECDEAGFARPWRQRLGDITYSIPWQYSIRWVIDEPFFNAIQKGNFSGTILTVTKGNAKG
jgi:hypothetical protein